VSSIIRVIKSRRIRWVWHIACMVRNGMHIGFRLEGQKKRDHLQDLDRITFQCVLERVGWYGLY
jgi:hypothetical protein